ncbi:hypothetical protein D3C80_2052060 [compost metagenome]
MLKQHEDFAQWLLDHAETDYNPPMPVIDTSKTPPNQVAEQIRDYVLSRWNKRTRKTPDEGLTQVHWQI